MPKREDIKSILVIGSGPIVIGQACEFDYSGAQACKVLREEGYRVILVNSNPATIMTDPELADATYVEPITPAFVEKVIAKERPDACLPTLGGQTGLTLAMELDKEGFLQQHNVRLIGTNAKAIDKAIFPGTQGGPLEHVIAAKAVCFKEAAQPEFKDYQEQVIRNAQVLAESLIEKGFNLVSGGTDNHLVLVNLVNKNLTGKKAENLLDEANITTNKNTVPNDPQSPFVTSGLRLGTPAMTSRGFKEDDVRKTVEAMALVLDNPDDSTSMEQAKTIVKELCDKYPLYQK